MRVPDDYIQEEEDEDEEGENNDHIWKAKSITATHENEMTTRRAVTSAELGLSFYYYYLLLLLYNNQLGVSTVCPLQLFSWECEYQSITKIIISMQLLTSTSSLLFFTVNSLHCVSIRVSSTPTRRGEAVCAFPIVGGWNGHVYVCLHCGCGFGRRGNIREAAHRGLEYYFCWGYNDIRRQQPASNVSTAVVSPALYLY